MASMFMIHPLNNPDAHIDHPFGEQRTTHKHKGVDIRAKSGSELYAIYDGVVVKSDNTTNPTGFGGLIVVKHDTPLGEIYSTYGHVKARYVSVGDIVEAGDIIGLSGGDASDPDRGNSLGAHLHFELGRSLLGSQFNPAPFLRTSQTIEGDGLNAFQRLWKGLEIGDYSTKDIDDYLKSNKVSKSLLQKFYDIIGPNSVSRISAALGRLGTAIGDRLKELSEESEKYDINDSSVQTNYFILKGGDVVAPMSGVIRKANCENGIAIQHTIYNTDKKETETFTTQFCDLKSVVSYTEGAKIEKNKLLGSSDGNSKAYIYVGQEAQQNPNKFEKSYELNEPGKQSNNNTEETFAQNQLKTIFKPVADRLSKEISNLEEETKRMKNLIKY